MNKILKYIELNPGLTTTQLARLIHPANKYTHYTPGSYNAKLIILCKQGKIKRVVGHSAISKTLKAWRHYIN